ncbi:hypothetical protein FGG78_26505 [Thioclava sp. BHET1]|nr:hypothetical protein FGG78_26505 [Thioclava sp. BHET1]
MGFAIGALITGLVLWAGVPPAGWMDVSVGRHLLIFAALSLIAWIALRAFVGVRRGQVKLWDRDINDN